MTRTDPSSCDAAQQRFFDVFERATSRSASQVLALIGTFGIVPSDEWLAPTPPREVAARMCRNLLSTHAEAALRPGAPLALLTAALALLPRPARRDGDTLTLRLQRFRHAAQAGEVALAQADFDEISAAHHALAGGMPEEMEGLMAAMMDTARATAHALGEQAAAAAGSAGA
jgi:hypothetical protein